MKLKEKLEALKEGERVNLSKLCTITGYRYEEIKEDLVNLIAKFPLFGYIREKDGVYHMQGMTIPVQISINHHTCIPMGGLISGEAVELSEKLNPPSTITLKRI